MNVRRCFVLPAAAALLMIFSGCVSAPKMVHLPYQAPEVTPEAVKTGAPTAAIVEVRDTRADPGLDSFVSQGGAEFVRGALAAELVKAGVFSRVNTAPGMLADEDYLLRVTLADASWAVPNHAGMVKTAFWTSFLTGGLGGLAYGSTDTPVFGRASLSLVVADGRDGSEVFTYQAESVHEAKMAKLKSDTMTTRAAMISQALEQAIAEIMQAATAARIGQVEAEAETTESILQDELPGEKTKSAP